MTNTSIIEEDKFGGVLFRIVKKDKNVEKGQPIEMRNEEKEGRKEAVKNIKYQG